MRLHGYLGSCDQGPKNVLSIAYRHNLNSLNCHNQSCLSWSFLHIDKMTKTCSEREKKMSFSHIIIVIIDIKSRSGLQSILFFKLIFIKNMQTYWLDNALHREVTHKSNICVLVLLMNMFLGKLLLTNSYPVFLINIFICLPFSRQKRILFGYYFSIEKCR